MTQLSQNVKNIVFHRLPRKAMPALILLLFACWKAPEKKAAQQAQPASVQSAGAAKAETGAAAVSQGSVPQGSVSGREILKRARLAVSSAESALLALSENPSSAALGKACVRLGEVEAYLVTLAYLASENLVNITPVQAKAPEKNAQDTSSQNASHEAAEAQPAQKPALHADPFGWVSTANRLAPLCSRPGSSADDFASDIVEVKENLRAVRQGLAKLS